MRMLRSIGLAMAAMFALGCASVNPALAAVPATTQFYAVIGDSISGAVPQGVAKDMYLSIITQEHNVVFRNLSSPGASLGHTDSTGFYNPTTTNMLTQLAGAYGALDGVIIQASTNDYSRNVNWGDSYNSAVAIMSWAQARGKKVLAMDALWRAGEDTANAGGNTLNTYRYFLNYACTQYPGTCTWVTRDTIVLGTSAGSANYDSAEVTAGTQLHPNKAGHRLMATWLGNAATAANLF